MPTDNRTIIFLVGLGAPIELYNDFIKTIRELIPHKKCHTLEWWNQDDFGQKELNQHLQNKNTILIGHSAGGSMAINALANSPDKVQRVIMVDSHAPVEVKSLPPIDKFLNSWLSQDGAEVIDKVKKAYVPVVKDPTIFNKAAEFLLKWLKTDLPKVGATIKAMPDHTVLHMGFTDLQYQILDDEQKNKLQKFWAQYNFDTEFLPMTHFDLIMPSKAKLIVQKISTWLD